MSSTRAAGLLFCAAACLGPTAAARGSAPPGGAAYDVEILAARVPAVVRQGEVIEVPLRLRNAGTVTWDPRQSFNVSYHWLNADGRTLVWEGERTPLPRAIRPGDDVVLNARLRPPPLTGRAFLRWDVVQESVTWFGARDPTPPAPIAVDVIPPTHAFTVLEQHAPRIVPAGQTRRIHLVIRNDGTQAWTLDRPIRISYHWIGRPTPGLYDGERTGLPHDVLPGSRAAVDAVLRTPTRPGLYRLQWDMVEENVTWFEQRDPTPERPIAVLVLPSLAIRAEEGATVAAILCLALALFVMRKAPPQKWLISAAAVADLIWLAAALSFKQYAVTEAVAGHAHPPSGWLMSSGAAAMTILVALLPRRARPAVAVAVNAAVSVLLAGDVIHVRFFGDVLSAASARLAGQLGSVVSSVLSLVEARDAWLFADLVPGIALAVCVARLGRNVPASVARRFAVALSALLLPAIAPLWRIHTATGGVLVQVFRNSLVADELGVLNYHARDVWLELRERATRRSLPPARQNEITQWFRAKGARRAGIGPWFGAARGRNLIMLQVESMQEFVIGLSIEGQEVTPNLNRWLASGALAFGGCSDQTAQGRTSDGEFVTQVSLLPPAQGSVAFTDPENHYDAIATILAQRGYHTLSAVAFDGAFWNRHVTHRQYGFQTSLFDTAFRPGRVVGWGLDDHDFLMQMARRLEALPTPYAALLITLTNHHPFESFPDDLKELRLGELEGTQLGNYLHGVHYFDRAFGDFLAELGRKGVLQTSLIAVWGDHDAGLTWTPAVAAAIGERPTEAGFYRAAKVPVIMAVPGVPRLDRRFPVHCGQTDVAPTLLALLGVDPAAFAFTGRNLLGTPGEDPTPSRYGVWTDPRLLYLPKGPKLEDGYCYDATTLHLLAAARCRAGYDETLWEMQVSSDVLKYDLQVKVSEALRAR